MISQITNLEKAAILLLSLGKKEAADIMSEMSRDEVEKVSVAMYSLKNISLEKKKEVVNNFINKVSCSDALLGNKIIITNILFTLLSAEEARRIINKLKLNNDVWSALDCMNPEVIALYLSKEKTHTAALILSKLSHSKVSQILPFIDEAKVTDIINSMVSLKDINPIVLKEIAAVIKSDLIDSAKSNISSVDNIKMLASVIGSMKKEQRQKYISALEKSHPKILDKLQSLMFNFEDIVKINLFGISKIIQATDLNILVLALKGASTSIQALFISQMSERMVKIIEQEWKSLGAVKRSEVLNAQEQIVNVVRKMLHAGTISEIEDE